MNHAFRDFRAAAVPTDCRNPEVAHATPPNLMTDVAATSRLPQVQSSRDCEDQTRVVDLDSSPITRRCRRTIDLRGFAPAHRQPNRPADPASGARSGRITTGFGFSGREAQIRSGSSVHGASHCRTSDMRAAPSSRLPSSPLRKFAHAFFQAASFKGWLCPQRSRMRATTALRSARVNFHSNGRAMLAK